MKIERDKLHLLHIRDAVEKVEAYSRDLTLATFMEEGRDFDAIMMQIMVVGESVNSLSEDFKNEYHELPWYQAVGLRNRIAHGYFDVDPEIIWQTVKKDLPSLKKEIEAILDKY